MQHEKTIAKEIEIAAVEAKWKKLEKLD
jgi:hypothetical protein